MIVEITAPRPAAYGPQTLPPRTLKSELTQYTLGLRECGGTSVDLTRLRRALGEVATPLLRANQPFWARTPCATGECIGGFTRLSPVAEVNGFSLFSLGALLQVIGHSGCSDLFYGSLGGPQGRSLDRG